MTIVHYLFTVLKIETHPSISGYGLYNSKVKKSYVDTPFLKISRNLGWFNDFLFASLRNRETFDIAMSKVECFVHTVDLDYLAHALISLSGKEICA